MELFQLNSKDNSNFKMMGVINITPDSFSDGGKYTSLIEIKKQIDHFRSYGCKVFDFGAESTAPVNQPITKEEELERLRPLFKLIESREFKDDEILSFDTYKIATFRHIISLIRDAGLKSRVIFNDVSGILDEELYKLMSEYEFDYVYSHSLVPSRDETSNHMNFLDEDIDLVKYFQSAKKEFANRDLLERVIFDPCFGFSKTTSQNLKLIAEIRSFIGVGESWLLGISRKSFLKGLSPSKIKEEQIFFSELLHSQILVNWMKNIQSQSILIRLHDPAVFLSAKYMK